MRLGVFVLSLLGLLCAFIPTANAGCEDDCCWFNFWDKEFDRTYGSHYVNMECPDGGSCDFWVERYIMPSVGPDDCFPAALCEFLDVIHADQLWDNPKVDNYGEDCEELITATAYCYKRISCTINCEPMPPEWSWVTDTWQSCC